MHVAMESRARESREGAIANVYRMSCLTFLLLACVAATGCTHPRRYELETFMLSDAEYFRLPRGPRRVDALWEHARFLTGSDVGALDLLGSLAVEDGLKLKHPFNSGLSEEGMLAPNDKTGHFFAHAMWRYHDYRRPYSVAEINSCGWEVVGEIRSWFGHGVGFNWKDIWANRLGWEFARHIRLNERTGKGKTIPSDVLKHADRFRPEQLPDEELSPPPKSPR